MSAEHLNDAIATTPMNVNHVNTLELTPQWEYGPTQLQDMVNKVNELTTALWRCPRRPRLPGLTSSALFAGMGERKPGLKPGSPRSFQMTTVPLYLLVGITRLISIHFALKSLDSIGAAVVTYGMQISVSPEMARLFPNVWALYLPSLAIYLGLVVLTWFAAPCICRLAMGSDIPAEPREGTCEKVAWGEIMIFLTGILLMCWGISRAAAGIMPILQATSRELHHELVLSDQLEFFVAFALTGAGGLLAARFPSVYRWCERRKREAIS